MPKKQHDYFHCDEQPVDQQLLDNPKLKKLCEQWKCRWRYNGVERFMSVVDGYIYDGGSVPRPVWSILGITPSGPGDCGFLPHDVGYRAKGGEKPEAYLGCSITDANGNTVIVSREEMDWVLGAGMRFGGIAAHRVAIAVPFVRVFGKRHWGGPIPAIRG